MWRALIDQVLAASARIGFEITETAVIDDPERRDRATSPPCRRRGHQDRDRRLRLGPVVARLSEAAARARAEDRPAVHPRPDREPPRSAAGALVDRSRPCAGDGGDRGGRRRPDDAVAAARDGLRHRPGLSDRPPLPLAELLAFLANAGEPVRAWPGTSRATGLGRHRHRGDSTLTRRKANRL